MKKLSVHIYAELEVPDDWEIIEVDDGVQVLKIDGTYVDFDIAPLASDSTGPDATWSDEDEDLTASILDAVIGLETELTLDA